MLSCKTTNKQKKKSKRTNKENKYIEWLESDEVRERKRAREKIPYLDCPECCNHLPFLHQWLRPPVGKEKTSDKKCSRHLWRCMADDFYAGFRHSISNIQSNSLTLERLYTHPHRLSAQPQSAGLEDGEREIVIRLLYLLIDYEYLQGMSSNIGYT